MVGSYYNVITNGTFITIPRWLHTMYVYMLHLCCIKEKWPYILKNTPGNHDTAQIVSDSLLSPRTRLFMSSFEAWFYWAPKQMILRRINVDWQKDAFIFSPNRTSGLLYFYYIYGNTLTEGFLWCRIRLLHFLCIPIADLHKCNC